jgi:hypothetical protein
MPAGHVGPGGPWSAHEDQVCLSGMTVLLCCG